MEFTQYQLDRIARFAAASESIHHNQLLLMTPGMIKPTLVLAMRSKKIPEISEPKLQNAIEAFKHLSAHRKKAKRVDKFVPAGLVLGAICGAFVWGRVGPAMAIAVGAVILAGIVLAKVAYGYLALRPIMQRFRLTYEEATFALSEMIDEPRWQADLR